MQIHVDRDIYEPVNPDFTVGYNCRVIELVPHEDAAVVWGKFNIPVDESFFSQQNMRRLR